MSHDTMERHATWFGEHPSEPELGPPARYSLIEFIGRGGMGEVYKAHDHRLDRMVALKLLHPHRVSTHMRHRLLEEARVTAKLPHPGVVPVHDIGEWDDGRMFFTMGLVEGRSLHDVLMDSRAGEAPIELRWVMRTFGRICETVGFAHDQGIVHLDLKPDNIMVGTHGELYVVDWGLARSSVSGRDGVTGGTVDYMAPEQDEVGASVGPPTDVYALGATLDAMLQACCTERSPSWEPLDRLMDRCLSCAMEERPEDASAVHAEVLAWEARRELDAVLDLANGAIDAGAEALATWTQGGSPEGLGEAIAEARFALEPLPASDTRVEALRARVAELHGWHVVARDDVLEARSLLADEFEGSDELRDALEDLLEQEQERREQEQGLWILEVASRHHMAAACVVLLVAAWQLLWAPEQGSREVALMIAVVGTVLYSAGLLASPRPRSATARDSMLAPLVLLCGLTIQRAVALWTRPAVAVQIETELWSLMLFFMASTRVVRGGLSNAAAAVVTAVLIRQGFEPAPTYRMYVFLAVANIAAQTHIASRAARRGN